MSLFVSSLNSGSNGNCYYIGNDQDAILIDAGLSRRETLRRMRRLDLSMKKVKAVFITHEHGDHIHGLHGILKKYLLPVYITPLTAANSHLTLERGSTYSFKPYEPMQVGSLTITAIPKFHDAVDANSFLVTDSTVTVGVFTDVGRPCDHTIKAFEKCHAAFLESNYDIEMLEKGTYSHALKSRIRDGLGHLSNLQAIQLFVNHRPPFMTHLFPAHLSRENNSVKIVEALFSGVAGTVEVVVATRFNETPVFEITGIGGSKNGLMNTNSKPKESVEQLSLF